MEAVTGIGGVFIRARDPDALTRWYADHLVIQAPPVSYDVRLWEQQAGPTVFAALPDDSPHFADAGAGWSINFRVRDLAAMVAQLRGAAIEVTVDEGTYPNGRFASLIDPEGLSIQLWEPAGADAVE